MVAHSRLLCAHEHRTLVYFRWSIHIENASLVNFPLISSLSGFPQHPFHFNFEMSSVCKCFGNDHRLCWLASGWFWWCGVAEFRCSKGSALVRWIHKRDGQPTTWYSEMKWPCPYRTESTTWVGSEPSPEDSDVMRLIFLNGVDDSRIKAIAFRLGVWCF